MIGEKEQSRENIRKGTITNPLNIPKRSGKAITNLPRRSIQKPILPRDHLI
jgi:hypothetical protein